MDEGRPPACCLHAEVAGHNQAPCMSDRPCPGHLQGAVGYGLLSTTCRQPTDRGTVRKGYRLQGRAAANRGSACRGGRPLEGRLPAGKGSRHLRRGDNDGTVRERGSDNGTHDAVAGDHNAR
ncbi:hypothetical protein BHE74_00039978 [Ensete ventricosum]|nr:hypothetical protein BHE74_00039978 [Ensete ventricosum]